MAKKSEPQTISPRHTKPKKRRRKRRASKAAASPRANKNQSVRKQAVSKNAAARTSSSTTKKRKRKPKPVGKQKRAAKKQEKRPLSRRARREKRIATGVFIFILCLMPLVGLYGFRQYQARQEAARIAQEREEEEEVETFADVYEVNEEVQIKNIQEAKGGSVVDAKGLSDEAIRALFTAAPLSDEQIDDMEDVTLFPDELSVPQEDLVYVRVLHKDFDENDRVGELIVNKAIYLDVIQVFYDLYKAKYPIEKMVLLDEYDGSLSLSQTDNNTSAFCMKDLDGKIVKDKRSQGLVIDLNPFYNPQINEKNNTVFPDSSMIYADRDVTEEVAKYNHMINSKDPAYQAFTTAGFSWGGELVSDQQYQLFTYDKSGVRSQSSSSKSSDSSKSKTEEKSSSNSSSTKDQQSEKSQESENQDSQNNQNSQDSVQDNQSQGSSQISGSESESANSWQNWSNGGSQESGQSDPYFNSLDPYGSDPSGSYGLYGSDGTDGVNGADGSYETDMQAQLDELNQSMQDLISGQSDTWSSGEESSGWY